MPLGRRFSTLWAASAISNLGDGVLIAALPLLAASLTRDPLTVSLVALAQGIPWLLFGLLSGALVDRLDRRRVMAIVDVGRGVAVGVLALSLALDVESLVLLCAVAFALGVGETLFDNAAQAIVPSIVERGDLEEANGKLELAEITMNSFAGPPLGGALFGAAIVAPFALQSGTFFVAALLVVTIPGTFRAAHFVRARATPRDLYAEIAEGVRWLWRHRLLRTLAVLLAGFNFVSTATLAVFVLLAQEVLGLDGFAFGVLLATNTLGGLLAALVGARSSRRLGSGPALMLALAASAAPYLLIGITSSAAVAGFAWAALGFGASMWNILTVSLRQAIVPDHLLGRVNSAYRSFGWGARPLGALVGGVLAKVIGLRAPFLAGGALLLVLLVLCAPLLTTSSIDAARAEAT